MFYYRRAYELNASIFAHRAEVYKTVNKRRM